MKYDQLKLENQLCFPVYAASRLITREYQPYLDELEITYPQYLVLMILWEKDEMPVNDIAKKLILNTNTITPLLKRMETQGLVNRERSKEDERKVIVKLTEIGNELKEKAVLIPERLASQLLEGPMGVEELIRLKEDLGKIINHLLRK
ncbi:MarR family winged helix-turn-helix transcriptional regulator [Carboxylicivirga caseinilyticus]|uniref:MarR family winged helix-turn-helix transcriptional regulator n=1 Tax=Carboxylicivirga caseinilyticus TaxID=3417572 RepID=UPI003D33C76B|nr:MarR family transcriptional regulator [Marinilabiliaceae bacterium A049]